MHPGRAAIIDSLHVARVNHEIYFFSDLKSRRAFLRNPLPYCGELTDPVSLARFRPTTKSPHTKFAGRAWYFSGRSTRATFQAMPDSFVVRRRGM